MDTFESTLIEHLSMNCNQSGNSGYEGWNEEVVLERKRSGANPQSRPTSRSATGELAWHYTTGQNFLGIQRSGVLMTTNVLMAERELPVVWFSRNQKWEPGSRMGVIEKGNPRLLSKQEMYDRFGGLARLGYLADDLLPWAKLRRIAKIPYAKSVMQERVGRSHGANPGDWMGHLEAIPASSLVAEILDKRGCWIRVGDPY